VASSMTSRVRPLVDRTVALSLEAGHPSPRQTSYVGHDLGGEPRISQVVPTSCAGGYTDPRAASAVLRLAFSERTHRMRNDGVEDFALC
jgi:hypothetical protein